MEKVKEKEQKVFEEDFNILEGVEDFFESKFTTNEEPPDISEEEEETTFAVDKNEKIIEKEEKPSDSSEENKIRGETSTDEEENTEEEDSSSPLTPYAKYLKEEGILPNLNLEDFDGSADSLKQGMSNEIQASVQEYVNSLPDRVKSIIENYQEGVSLEKLLKMDAEKIKYSSISSEQLLDEEVQKNVLRDFYKKTTKFTEPRIEKEIKRLGDLQELQEEASSVLKELVVLQEEEELAETKLAQSQRQQVEQDRLEQLASIQSKIKETDEFIPGVKVSQLVKDKLFKNVTTPVGYDERGQAVNKLGAYRIQNPVEAELIFNYIFEVTKEFSDWSTLSKSGKKTALLELEKAARSLDTKSSATRIPKDREKSTNDLMLAIDQFEF